MTIGNNNPAGSERERVADAECLAAPSPDPILGGAWSDSCIGVVDRVLRCYGMEIATTEMRQDRRIADPPTTTLAHPLEGVLFLEHYLSRIEEDLE